VGLCLFTKIVADGSATLVESLLILSLYVVYVIVIIITYYCYKTSDHVPQHHEHSPIEDFRSMSEDKVPLIELVSAGLIGEDAGENTTATDDIIIDSAIPVTKRARLEKCCLRFFDCVSHPLVVFFNFSIPDLFDAAMCGARAPRHVQLPGSELRYGHSPFCCHTGKVTLFRALSVIAVSIGYVCIFATIVVELCGLITRYGGFDQTTVGATLVAFGAQVLFFNLIVFGFRICINGVVCLFFSFQIL
jgi:Ca2+/Na+ antiporter